ncbi:MAG: cytochrome c [Gammaproteobacteria bacterium]|jgi:mono/diheme cytochrome c family protein
MKKIISTAVVVVALLIVGGVIYIYSGSYSVAATSKDSPLVSWILRTTRESSVETRAANVKPPAGLSLSDPEEVKLGFKHYNEMCKGCHGAPGVKPAEVHDGLNPEPPDLSKVAKKASADELFWVVKHGLKMTGMPAWGPTHSDDKLWAVVAFVKKLPEITPEKYHQMQQQLAENGEMENENAHREAQQNPAAHTANNDNKADK